MVDVEQIIEPDGRGDIYEHSNALDKVITWGEWDISRIDKVYLYQYHKHYLYRNESQRGEGQGHLMEINASRFDGISRYI